MLKAGGLLAATIAAALTVASPATARPFGHHGGWHRGAGVGLGFATGALIGGALASRPYGYGYAPYAAYDEPYVVDEGYASGGNDQYCMRRFKSYDPTSGTYLGYDGARHPCP
jgi:hypothetical protein